MNLAIAFSLALTAALAAPSPAPPQAPHFTGETTDGRSVSLPEAGRGKPLVVIVGMTRASANATERWSDALAAHEGDRATIYGVALLDKVPGFARSWVKHALAKSIGPPVPGKGSFLMTFDGKALRDSAPGGNEDDPVIYLFRADGSLLAVTRKAYSDEAASELEKSVP